MAEVTKAAPPAPAAQEKHKRGQERPWRFASAEEAIKEANSRTEGPREAFKVTLKDKTWYICHANARHAGYMALLDIGGVVEPIGKPPRAPRQLGVEGILQAVNQ